MSTDIQVFTTGSCASIPHSSRWQQLRTTCAEKHKASAEVKTTCNGTHESSFLQVESGESVSGTNENGGAGGRVGKRDFELAWHRWACEICIRSLYFYYCTEGSVTFFSCETLSSAWKHCLQQFGDTKRLKLKEITSWWVLKVLWNYDIMFWIFLYKQTYEKRSICQWCWTVQRLPSDWKLATDDSSRLATAILGL